MKNTGGVILAVVAVAMLIGIGAFTYRIIADMKNNMVPAPPPSAWTPATSAPVSDHPMAVTEANFQREVLQADVPVLVDFWAPWCGPCRALAPTIDEIHREQAGSAKVVKVNTDENQRLADKYRIQAIPTLILFKNGKEVQRLVGGRAKADIVKELESLK